MACTTDADGDGHVDAACGGDDCDDTDASRFPENPEVCDLEDHDEDCDPLTYGAKDLDRDGFDDALCCNVDESRGARTCGEDCDDTRRGTNPIVPEVCDRRDNDCDGMVDEEVALALYRDMDRDLHGDPLVETMACPGVAGYSSLDDDCDDGNRVRHEAQVEIIDSLDNDCDGSVDEMPMEVTWYRDVDGDGFGAASGGTVRATSQPAGYALRATDCDDADPDRSPIGTELCNGIDDDCSGDSDFVLGVNDWEDDDGDGHPDVSCPGSSAGRDCNDRDPDIYAGAPERCNGLDDDCDTRIDEACGVGPGVDAGPRDLDAGAPGADGGPPACGGMDQPCCVPGSLGGADPDSDGCNGDPMSGLDCDLGTCRPCAGDSGAAGDCAGGIVCSFFSGYETLSCVNLSPGYTAICCRAAPVDAGAPMPDTGPPADGGCGPEICNTLDDDCDTRFDEGNPGGGGACGSSTGECVPGVEECMGGSLVCVGATGPVAESCNGADDDCDGSFDEAAGATCAPLGDSCAAATCRCGSGPPCFGGMTCSGGTCLP